MRVHLRDMLVSALVDSAQGKLSDDIGLGIARLQPQWELVCGNNARPLRELFYFHDLLFAGCVEERTSVSFAFVIR